MNRRDALDLAAAIERFVDGSDQSAQLAAEIEDVIIECCQDQEWFDEVSEALALYVPGGGGFYIDEQRLASELRTVYGLLGPGLDEAE